MAKKTKLYEIQPNVPFPLHAGDSRGRWVGLLKSMKEGDSMLLKNRDEYAAFHKAATALKIKITSRTEETFVRVWRLPAKEKTDATNNTKK